MKYYELIIEVTEFRARRQISARVAERFTLTSHMAEVAGSSPLSGDHGLFDFPVRKGPEYLKALLRGKFR